MSDRRDTSHAAHWLSLALGDFATATAIRDDARLPLRGAAALAQQAAEKAVKALIALGGPEPPRIHDLARLASLTPSGARIELVALDLAALTDAGQSARYPDMLEPPYERAEVDRLIEDAGAVVRMAEQYLRAHGLDVDRLERR